MLEEVPGTFEFAPAVTLNEFRQINVPYIKRNGIAEKLDPPFVYSIALDIVIISQSYSKGTHFLRHTSSNHLFSSRKVA